MRASAGFDIDEWTDEPIDDGDGTPRRRAHVRKTFRGDLTGRGEAELLLAGTPVDGSMAYVGMERITGGLAGRAGTFLLLHSAIADGGAPAGASGASVSWTVVPDSGTGELTGLRGTAEITQAPDGAHTLTLDYEPASAADVGTARR